MARPHRPVQGSRYEKRRVAGTVAPPLQKGDGLSSSEARELGSRIDASQQRYRVSAIRLLADRACGLVLVDSVTGSDHVIASSADWHRLEAAQT
jgi:hypothetical protein